MFKNRHIKKRLPIKQLQDASIVASQMLIDKKIAHGQNVLEEIVKLSNAPILPGVPRYYLPHRWTIEVATNQMYNMLKDWGELKKDHVDQDRASEFFKYVVGVMKDKEYTYKQEVKKTDKTIKDIEGTPVISDIFSPLRKYQTIKALHKFFVDSFVVSVVVKSNGSTSEYADWFLNDWMPSLYQLWSKQNEENSMGKGL